MVNFPAPVGGTPFPIDFAPSFTFAVLYAALVPLMVYRMFTKRSRSILLIGTIAFSIERIVIFALRAVQSRNESRRLSPGLTTYMQISFAIGFISIANSINSLVRCLLVNPTYGSSTYGQSAAAASKGGLMGPPLLGTPDYPKARQWMRRGTGIMALSFIGAIILGLVANTHYNKTFDNQQRADTTELLRFINTVVTLVLTVVLFTATVLGKLLLPRICNRAVLVTSTMITLMCIISIYRLAVMGQRTTSLEIVGPLDTTGAKAAFYILHVLPEWLAALVLFGGNTRQTFGAGMFGDYRLRDETEAQKQKREMKETELDKQRMLDMSQSDVTAI
ncbi:hypothetical protein BDN70DRAFT_907460 [Pholiota conissans]|uniref:Uncharacterized protein n=1 Tax=Pholiota conissans TaxID=109636 RepID=A0A9P6CXT9_9AGAR|nr:hypothetical protein BDN70DRAFT_907460 [Pholiota conissans]